MKYNDYRVEDFATNEFFVRWVRFPDEETDHFWRRWLANYPEKHEEVNQARQLVMSVHYARRFEMTDAQYVQLFERIQKPMPTKPAATAQPSFGRASGGNLLRYAAAALIPALLLSLYWYSRHATTKQPQELAAAVEQIEKYNPNGQRSILKLSDGTVVRLNSASKLSFPEQFADSQRVVVLEGEAFFEVAKDAGRPFVVVANGLKVRVLGTKFNVESSNSRTSVALLEGGVEINDLQGNRIGLAPLEQLSYDQSAKEMVKKPFDPAQVLAWTENRLLFSNTEYPDVFRELEKWYGVEIEVANPGKLKGRYSGAYINAPLTEVLDGIGLVSGFRYELKERKVRIFTNGG